jgi:phosphoribosylamine--glycine ligase
MNILVIGSGGREHALAWKIAQSPRTATVFVAPGNAGTASEPKLVNVSISEIDELVSFAQQEHITLTVVGPEAPLAAGIVDVFRQAGLKIFGPTKMAAQLESSKDFAKAFMVRHHIPTAAYATFSDAKTAHAYIQTQSMPIVIKADGLAAGKGVIVAKTAEEAHAAIDMMLLKNGLGDAGARVVIEAFLTGEEASFIVMVDGEHVLPLATSQDHKRLLNNDEGPNTGGMGAFSPATIITPDIHAKVMREVILPTIQGMREEGIQFTGFLYAGLMVSPDGEIKVLEFNCRMGDPETQPILLRLKSDLVTLLEHAVNGTLDQVEAEWDRRFALGVVLAAKGYPDNPRKGDIITGLSLKSKSRDFHIFHGGTALNIQQQITAQGGRVLCVTALGDSVRMAQKRAYDLVSKVHFDGAQYRTDIGFRALKKHDSQ